MNKTILNLCLNKNIKIIIQKKKFDDIFDCTYEASILLTHYNHKFILDVGHLASNIELLKINLNKSLINQFKFPHNIENVGYDWNFTLNQPKKLNSALGENFNIINNYLLYSFNNVCTWIYNDPEGNIILEITPLYPYTYAYRKKKPTYGHFLTWMQHYKTLFKKIIPRNIAEQWLIQAQQILDAIDENTQILHEQGKL